MVTDRQGGIGLRMPGSRRATTVLGVVLCLERRWDERTRMGERMRRKHGTGEVHRHSLSPTA